jgi:hypothetical protein
MKSKCFEYIVEIKIFNYSILPLNPLNSIIVNFFDVQIPGMLIEYAKVTCLWCSV